MSSRTDHFQRWLSPALRFWWGLLLMGITLFQRTWWGALAQCLVFGLAGILSGKKIRMGYFLFLAGTITFFQLLTPMGRVLWNWGPWVLTDMALSEGLRRGFNLVSLVFLSLFCISPKLRLPGSLGGLLSRSFAYFEALTLSKKDLNPKDLVGSIDLLFHRVYQENIPIPETASEEPHRTTLAGYLFMGGLTFVSLLLTMEW